MLLDSLRKHFYIFYFISVMYIIYSSKIVYAGKSTVPFCEQIENEVKPFRFKIFSDFIYS